MVRQPKPYLLGEVDRRTCTKFLEEQRELFQVGVGDRRLVRRLLEFAFLL